MIYYVTMKVVNIAEAKAKLSEIIDAVSSGERVLISKRNQPVAELCPVKSARVHPRPVGKAAGALVVPEAFFDPLPEDVVEAFTGRAEPGRAAARQAKVAEAPPAYGAGRTRRRG
jgi:prevent-host-death family protein